jgi:hypothetical protein
MQAGAATANQAQIMAGADKQQQMILDGKAAQQAAQFGQQATLAGMDYGSLGGANEAYQAGLSNQVAESTAASSAAASKAASKSANKSNLLGTVAQIASKYFMKCIPKGVKIDGVNGGINVEDIKPGDMVIGYDGNPVRVLQLHSYLEDPTSERFYEVEFNNGAKVNVCDKHKIKGIASEDITEGVLSKRVYSGVEFSYDLLTEDLGYRIQGIPVNSMTGEMAEMITKLNKK